MTVREAKIRVVHGRLAKDKGVSGKVSSRSLHEAYAHGKRTPKEEKREDMERERQSGE